MLQLHRDAAPGRLLGRIVHIGSGQAADFAGSTALLDWLEAQLAGAPASTESESPTP